jgi:hypothetical protein
MIARRAPILPIQLKALAAKCCAPGNQRKNLFATRSEAFFHISKVELQAIESVASVIS